MAAPAFDHTITDLDQLGELYRQPSDGAVNKEIDHLDESAAAFIAASPFCLVGTADSTGLTDVSPKGGDPGFAKVLDERRLVIPDLNGNNRLDSLRNIVANPRAGLLFLVPEEGATLRVKGRASITADPSILGLFEEYRQPATAIGIEVESVFMHCAKCIRRAGLWRPEG
ncbi:MAG: pyridoxamine 5'-phosphate oxidase family protein, partial [Actinomycetota bacterium]|nr:pyridoxamine 5'-phosphate oxidase family protein [Actinomycetota bacterium]